MNKALARVGYVAAAVWILGGALFFYLRLTILIYMDQRESIQHFLSSLFGG